MAKDDQQRITDTLNFLEDTTLVPGAVRQKELASDYVNEAFPDPDSPAYQQFSQSLSLGFHLMSDPEPAAPDDPRAVSAMPGDESFW